MNTNNENLISVVIPAYNRSKSISKCLDSIVGQTLLPLEIIVVDDCSTDDTVDLIDSHQSNLVRSIALEQNRGAQYARNIGIKAAKGDWIAFLDSDDEWLPRYLEKQLGLALKHNVNIVYSGAYVDDGKNKREYKMPDYSKDSYRQLLENPGPMFQGLFVKKECLKKIDYLDEQVVAFQEWDTSIRLAENNSFIFNSEPLFIYNLHEDETISKNAKNGVLGYEYIVDKHKGSIISIAGINNYIQHLYKIQSKYFNLKDWKEWRKYSLNILKQNPTKVSYVWFKKTLIYVAPKFYQRFQNYITPLFALKRIYFVLNKKLKLKT